MSTIFGNTSRYGAHYLIKNLAASLFGVFIPVYLYANGFSLVQVGIFYFCQEVCNLFFTYALYKKIYVWGIKNTLILATIAQILLLLVTYNFLAPTYLFLLVLSFVRGWHDSFYWGANEVMMVHLSGDHVGQFLARWNFTITILQILIVPLSAYILDHYSPVWLIIFSIGLLVGAIIPLIKINLSNLKNNSVIPLKKLIKSNDNKYIGIVGHLSEFLTKINDFIIPVYLFTIFANYFSVGIASAVAIAGSAFYSYIISIRSEQTRSRRLLLAAHLLAFIILIMIFSISRSHVILYVLISLLAFSRLGVYLSSTVGINKLCLVSDCYARKMFARMSENVAGMMSGGVLILSGIFSFQIGFILIGLYVLLLGRGIYAFKESI